MNAFVVVAVLALSQAAVASGPAQDALAGCYAIKLGAWQPVVAMGPEARLLMPPSHIRLSGTRGSRGWARRHLVVVPALGATSQHEAMYWDVTAEGEVQLLFTSGSAGITVLLRRTETGLSGTARSFWSHGPHSEQTAPVTLESVSCTP